MRRFLDWTSAQSSAAQQSSGLSGPNNSSRSSANQFGFNLSQPSPYSVESAVTMHQATPLARQQQQQQTHSHTSLGATNPDLELEIQHLIKLLNEIKYYQASSSPLPSAASSQSKLEFYDKIHRTLPLFLNIFNLQQQQLSKTMGQEQSTEARSALSRQNTEMSNQKSAIDERQESRPTASRLPPMDLFPDLLPFSFTIARLFVSEVRQKASNKHAEDAALAILKFLNHEASAPLSSDSVPEKADKLDHASEQQSPTSNLQSEKPHSSEPDYSSQHGWNLLLSLNTLALSQNPQIIQLLCDASLPSTLVKCLYLFFDLPTSKSSDEVETESKGDAILEAKRENDHSFALQVISGPLMNVFTSILVQLCSNQSAIDELIKKDDLRLLIGLASSQCKEHNKPWKTIAFQTLLAISKHMTGNFMYLEQNLCMQIYVENMYRVNSLGLATYDEFDEMIKTLIEFLYNLDVNNRNQSRSIAPLVEQFKTSRIIELYEEILFGIDDIIIQETQSQQPSPKSYVGSPKTTTSQKTSTSSEASAKIEDLRRCGKSMIHSLISMAKINISPESMATIMTSKPLSMNRFEMLDQFKMPRPSAKHCILNLEVLRLMKLMWSKLKDIYLIEAILDATISLFNEDKYNYFVLESQQVLVYYMTSSNFKSFTNKVKQKLFKFLEFIIIETNYIPCLELGTLGSLLKSSSITDGDTVLYLRTLIACLKFNSKFSDIFRDIGLLEVIIDLLTQTMQQDSLNHRPFGFDVLCLLLEASQHLLAGPNNLNCTQFNESGAARHVFNCLSKPEFFQISLPMHGSSSDESNIENLTPRTATPPLSSCYKSQSLLSVVHSSTNFPQVDNITNRPSIKLVQKVAFTIIRQLILSNAGDEHLANLLGLLARDLDDLRNLGTSLGDEDGGASPTPAKTRINFNFLLAQEVNLKICILKSLMIILKDSHRCRTLFRKAGGFVYIVSALINLEKSLPSPDEHKETAQSAYSWKSVNSRRIWRLIKNALMTLVVALRFEPANLRAFSDDVINKFTEALRRLGCFDHKVIALRSSESPQSDQSDSERNTFKSIFLAPPTRDLSTLTRDNIKATEACCQLFRFLYDMSLDMGDGTAELEVHFTRHGVYQSERQPNMNSNKSISFDQGGSVDTLHYITRESDVFKRRSQLQTAPKRPPSLDLNARNHPAILTFPCIIISIIDLIPSSPTDELMDFVCIVIKSLFKHERNQQMLCEAGLISKLLSPNWCVALTDKKHLLHDITEFMFERLSKQSITAKELRMFLRLGEPLRCKNLDDIDVTQINDDIRHCDSNPSNDTSTEVGRSVKEKISKDSIQAFLFILADDKSKIQPPFIEFDLSTNGFSCIFMPSIAPINVKNLSPNTNSFLHSTLDLHTSEKNGILGGVGTTERQFPPSNGLTFSSWVCIDSFPARSSDTAHNIRLLTVYRGSAATGKEYSCLRVQVSSLDRALIISTQEVLLFDNENRNDAQSDPDSNVRIWTPELLVEGKWHHIVITISRPTSKQSMIYVYVDGVLAHQQRICYISQFVGTTQSGSLGNIGSSNTSGGSAAAFVNAVIGSLPQFRFQLRTRWKQGPCYLVEEALSPSLVTLIHGLGPNFIGNFQGLQRLHDANRSSRLQHGHSEARGSNKRDQSRHLVHQQSAAAVGPSHVQGIPLTRVSSSNLASMTPSQSSAQNQFNLPEDRILMTVDARASSMMTLSRMRRIYTRFDCRQVSRALGVSVHENSTPLLLLHNTGLHLNGPSRGVGAITVIYNHLRYFVPSPVHQTLSRVGGSYVLLGFIAQAEDVESFEISYKCLVRALKHSPQLQAQMDDINGYQILSVFFWKKKHLLTSTILKLTFSLVLGSAQGNCKDEQSRLTTQAIQRPGALRDLVCECFDLWLQTDMIDLVIEFIHELVNSDTSCSASGTTPSHRPTSLSASMSSSNIRLKNLKCLRDMDLLPRMLRLLPQYDRDPQQTDMRTQELSGDPLNSPFGAKSVYLIKQTAFELLNRTPRQSDILYFGQFIASLLPSSKSERPRQSISLRNILLKSLLQMMTKNKQTEVNGAMQEEIVRILGFDWFMLFISGPHLDIETVTLGLLNLMVVLSNDDLFANFKSKGTHNGGWLKEPTFPTMDGKFNIQLLGINVGVFLGLSGKKKSIRQDILAAPNLFLLSNSLANFYHLPRAYLVLFLTMMSQFVNLDSQVMEVIALYEKLDFDSLCDCLIGDTHHKRRQSLPKIQFRCHELVVCVINMLREVMVHDQIDENDESSPAYYPQDVTKFIIYLYNNNTEFQSYCRRSDELLDALCDCLMEPADEINELRDLSPSKRRHDRPMIQHISAKDILELLKSLIIDTMQEVAQSDEAGTLDQMHSLERCFEALSPCSEAQGSLADMILRQVLLMIDSTSRQSSIKTINASENMAQFQSLLINSIFIAHVVTDKIWHSELYVNSLGSVLGIIDHQLCLVEQVFGFNEILPKHNPPRAFTMQRVLNRTILFAMSRPVLHMSDKMLILDLLKKVHDNRTLIIINHMQSANSIEFFICMTYCLMRLMSENSVPTQNVTPPESASLIERQYGNHQAARSPAESPSSVDLMIVSMARKIWDTIYQSKKTILSEALEVSLSLPAFTLETSPDLMSLKPDIIDVCERYWASFLDAEQKPRKRFQPKKNESAQGTATSTAVNLLSGKLTRVVNAASFVSRVVGATAGSMASNVNLVGEKLTQTSRVGRKDSAARSSTESTPTNAINASSNNSSPGQGQSGQTPVVCLSRIDQSDLFRCAGIGKRHIDDAQLTHISIIEDFVETQLSQKSHKLALHKYLCDEWLEVEHETLLRERAVFGPERGTVLEKWCLDMTEGPRRMRKKMVNNTKQFYENYPYSPDQYDPDNKSLRYRPPMSYDSYHYYMKNLKLSNHLLENPPPPAIQNSVPEPDTSNQPASVDGAIDKETTGQENLDTSGTAPEEAISPAINIDRYSSKSSLESKDIQGDPILRNSPISPNLGRLSAVEPSSPRPSEGDQDDGDTTSFVDFSPEIEAESNSARESENLDSLSVLRLLEKNERISHMFRCSRVQGLDTYEGLLLFGREHFYLIDGFTLLKTREIKDIDSLPPDAHDPIIPNSTPNILAHSTKTCAKFAFDSVLEVHKRRYLLQPIALEVFSSDGRNTLLVFPKTIRNKVYSRLTTVATHLNNSGHESLAGQKSTVSVEGGSGLLSNLIGDTSVTQRWVRGELSNFQYLMNLNTIAGRSYNDLMQYPVFPWIVADYTSDYLDLTKPSSFRNLSRPVGAQTSERLEQFKRRFAEWDDQETPPYHYGTFYSSAMIVASYLVRMEPFTQHFLRLQGGHFDLADRMFHSIGDSWMSASKHNMADIKELVPEFFYLPDFLKNENKYDLGIKQSGQKLDDVILPPWAKNDPREFIRVHRNALESDYVSAHLHEWIDLIFGYKQQGQAAIDATNVFHHLFYEGNVDIYNTEIDPIKKSAVIGFINNFGQVPKQLFKKPHPVRKVTSRYANASPAPILPSLSTASSTNNQQRVLTHCPQALRQTNSNIKDLRGPVGQIVQIDKSVVAVEQNKLLIPPECCRYIAWGHADRSLRLGLYDSEKPIFVWEGSDNLAPNEILCCTIPNSRTMITAGTDSLITVWNIEKMRSFQPVLHLYGHVEPVTCLASSQAYSLIVSGSRDRTAIIWDLNRFTFVRQLGEPGDESLGLHQGPVSAISINDSTGDIATCSASWLYLWSVNGQLLAQLDTLSATIQQLISGTSSFSSNMGQLHLLSVCFSQHFEWDLDEVIVTGASDGSVAIWSMRYYQCAMSKAEIEAAKARERELNVSTLSNNSQETNSTPEIGDNESYDKHTSVGEDDAQVSTSTQAHDAQKTELYQTETTEVHSTSETIPITGKRQRTDTINSDWVRLSASSTHSIGQNEPTTPRLREASPSSIDGENNQQSESGESSLERVSIKRMQATTAGLEEPSEANNKESSGSTTNNEDLAQNNGQNKLSATDQSHIKFSKSDNSLIDSFVILGESNSNQTDTKDTNNERLRSQSSMGRQSSNVMSSGRGRGTGQSTHAPRSSHQLLPNHKWKRELYLRTLLPRRGGKTLPAAVTSLTISKDNKILFVGDANGKISTWSTNT